MKTLRFSKPVSCIAALFVACLMSGCIATQADILQMESRMDDLNSNIANMQKNQADLAVKMDELSGNLSSFSENLKDFDDRVSRLSAKFDDIEAVIGGKITALGRTIKEQNERAVSVILPSKIYHESYVNLVKKKYRLAVEGFELYLEKYPKGELVENAYYNLGQAQGSRGKWTEASIAYANILEKFPKSRQTPTVRLNYALAILKLPGSHKKEAMRYLQSILKDYPKSPQAKLAKKHLQRLKPKPKKPAVKKAAAKEATKTKKATKAPAKESSTKRSPSKSKTH